jgi:cytochrome P450
MMDMRPEPFEPPAPVPRTVPPSKLEIIRTVFRNPLELWGEPSYTLPWIMTSFFGEKTLIVNDPGLIKYLLVDNAANYKMAVVRQLVLRPILRDGLLTAEGAVWRRSRKAVAPIFTPRHAKGFATQMLAQSELYARKYEAAGAEGTVFDIGNDMTELAFAILSDTLFSGEIVTSSDRFADDVDDLLHSMGRVDPMDLLRAPAWVPRVTRIGGARVLEKFRRIVRDTMELRLKRMAGTAGEAPNDFLTLLLRAAGPEGLTMEEVEDNILTFIGAGHETTARALAWTLYCVANSPHVREAMEAEIDQVLAGGADPVEWLDLMPWTRAAFEEALRLFPPAPSINRQAIADDSWTSPSGERVVIPKDVTILVMPWTLHRHQLLWQKPRAFVPERFLPENRDAIHRFQYLPFGAGPRICIGATFAMQEAIIALGVLMHRFRFDMTETTRPWPVQRLTTQPANGLALRVTARPRASATS